MELVLWKPQPEFLGHKLQNFTSCNKEEREASRQDTPKMPFLRQVDLLEEDKSHILNLDCDNDPLWGREEEEMELWEEFLLFFFFSDKFWAEVGFHEYCQL